MSTPHTSPFIFHAMWDLVCDAIPLDTLFTYSDLRPHIQADPELSTHSAKTLANGWATVVHYGVATRQLRREGRGLYAWEPTPPPDTNHQPPITP